MPDRPVLAPYQVGMNFTAKQFLKNDPFGIKPTFILGRNYSSGAGTVIPVTYRSGRQELIYADWQDFIEASADGVRLTQLQATLDGHTIVFQLETQNQMGTMTTTRWFVWRVGWEVAEPIMPEVTSPSWDATQGVHLSRDGKILWSAHLTPGAVHIGRLNIANDRWVEYPTISVPSGQTHLQSTTFVEAGSREDVLLGSHWGSFDSKKKWRPKGGPAPFNVFPEEGILVYRTSDDKNIQLDIKNQKSHLSRHLVIPKANFIASPMVESVFIDGANLEVLMGGKLQVFNAATLDPLKIPKWAVMQLGGKGIGLDLEHRLDFWLHVQNLSPTGARVGPKISRYFNEGLGGESLAIGSQFGVIFIGLGFMNAIYRTYLTFENYSITIADWRSPSTLSVYHGHLDPADDTGYIYGD